MWFRNKNIMILSLRNVEIFLVLFFFPLWKMNYLQGSSSGYCHIRHFRGSRQLAIFFGKMNIVGNYLLFFFK